MNIVRTKQAVVAAILLTVAALAYTLAVYATLPQRIPTHWGWRGEVDGWGDKTMAAFLMPGMMVLLLGMLLALPWLSPRNFSVDSFRETFNYVMLMAVALMGYLHVVMLHAGLHPGLDMGRVLVGGILLFLALMGNVLGKVRRNFWMGVRTPWTLASETVWIATHRLAARLWASVGLVGALAVWLGAPVAGCFVVFMVVVFVPVFHSLVLYKRLEHEGRL